MYSFCGGSELTKVFFDFDISFFEIFTKCAKIINPLLISLNDKVVIFGMTFKVRLYEWAIDFYGHVVGACII